MISAAQCRAARGLLNWTQDDLARAAEVGVVTVRQFEAEKGSARSATVRVIAQAFEQAGIEFIPENGGGRGVRLKRRDRANEGLRPEQLSADNDDGMGR